MARSFRTLRKALAPRWLTEEEGELVGFSLDVQVDAFVERLRLGLLARFPSYGPDDALAAMGRDRRVVRGINESTASYINRLLPWLDDRKRQGNPFALLQKLAEYMGPLPKIRTVDARGNWFTRNVDGTFSWVLNSGNWHWDEDPPQKWSKFWVIIYPNGLWSPWPNNWGDASGPGWGTPTGSLGSTMPADVVDTLRSIVSDWHPAGTHCVNIILAFDNASFDPSSPEPDGLWAHWSKNVGGVQVPARLSTARYLDGV